MTETQIRFNDGAAYEQMMGKWSRPAGEVFLDWLAPPPAMSWLDVGCGNGAFTELIAERCAPAAISGIDPSEGQLAFARTRPSADSTTFQLGDAMALPYAAASFDAAVMALVIFFVPTPAKGVAEMVRVVRPGGMVAAYAWDMAGGGFPLEPIYEEIRAAGLQPLFPPSVDASRIDALHTLWSDAGLTNIETRQITIQRTFADFEDFWKVSSQGPAVQPILSTMSNAEASALKSRVSARLPVAADGRLTFSARANAVKGLVPA
jgi:ubiquinone/menaquinone biosynthesis C-methylase UbiE